MAVNKVYANQSVVSVCKKEDSELFAQMDMAALQKAMQDLDGNSFKLWMYFVRNKNRYEFALSPKALEDWGVKKDSYYRSKKILIEKGYLIENGDKLEFRDTPKIRYEF